MIKALAMSVLVCDTIKLLTRSPTLQPCQNSKDPTQSLPSSRVFKLPNNDDYIEEGKKRPLKTRPVELVGQGMPATAYTTGGWPSVSER